MSRIGNSPITILEGVEVKVEGNHVTVKGPKGTLEKDVSDKMKITVEDGKVVIKRPNDEDSMKSLHGLTRSLINNMVMGVKNEFKKELEINGVGYRVQKQGNDLNLTLGYSHSVIYKAPNRNLI